MKRITALLLALLMALSPIACGGVKENTSVDELINGVVEEVIRENTETENTTEPAEQTAAPTAHTTAPTAQEGPTELQKQWNGWYFGCIDLDGCTGNWESLNGSTYDATLYIELGADGTGMFGIYDPTGILVQNEYGNLYVQAQCHADENYLYGDSGFAFNDAELNTVDWRFVHNLSDPAKLNVGSTSKEADGSVLGYDFQFRPWGDRWENDSYAQFIPYFASYIDALDHGLTSPFDDSFQGYGIAEPIAEQPQQQTATPDVSSGSTDTGTGESSALLGANPAKLDVNDRGIVTVLYPADQFAYDDLYGKLKNETTGVGILIDPMLGATNFDELKASYEQNNSSEDEYSLVETTVNGYKALVLKYSDWLGATMRIDIDFGGSHDGWYGISFAVSGDTLADCDTELVWAIIRSMSLLK